MILTGSEGFLGKIIKNVYEDELLTLSRSNAMFNIDISRPFSFDREICVDWVFHAAGMAHLIPQTNAEEQAFYATNLQGTQHLCQALDSLERLPSSFFFISTVAVYGEESGENIDENFPLNGKSPYARSKILAENFIQAWCKERSITCSILRLPLLAGAKPPGNLGAMVSGIRTGKYLSIGPAAARKSILWAADIAQVLPKLATIGGIYNLSDGYHPSFAELETAISEALSKKKPKKIPLWAARLLARAGDLIGPKFPFNSVKLDKITSSLTFDDRKARQLIGWNPTPVLSKIQEII